MRRCDESIKKIFKLAQNMLELADEGDAVREDAGCGVLYGIVRDSAFKIRKMAEAEWDVHMKKGWWNGRCKSCGKDLRCSAKHDRGDKI